MPGHSCINCENNLAEQLLTRAEHPVIRRILRSRGRCLHPVLFAAARHAAWNAMLKGETGDRLWTITIMSLAVALVGAAAIPFLPPLAPAGWPYVVASGLLHRL
jgi:hypothetical protein